jgi:translocation and assembly module TamB
MRPAWTSRRRIVLLASSLLSGLLLAGSLLWLPDWSHDAVLTQLESVFGRKVEADSVRFRFFPAEMEIRNLRVAGARPGDPDWLDVPRISILPSFGLIWERRIVLSRVRIEKPVVRVQAFASGGDNVPRLHMGDRGALGVRIRRLTIEGGELLLDHERVPLELDLPEFTGRLNARRGGVLAGEVTLGPGEARFGTAPPIRLEARLDLVAEGPRFELESGHVRTDGSDLTVRGELKLARQPEGLFHLDGTLDLAELDRHVTRTGFALTGVSHYRGELQVDGSKLALRGRVEGVDGSWKGTPVPRFAAEAAWDDDGVRLRGLEMAVFGGDARLDLDVPGPGRTTRLTGRLEHVDADLAVARLFEIGTVGVGSRATGDVRLEWPRGRFREVTGRVGLDLEPIADGRTAARGRFTWSAVRGVQTLEHVELTTAEGQASFAGRIARDGRAEISVDARSGDLAASDALIARARHALGNAGARPFEVAGSGSFQGHWLGSLSAPVFEGRLAGTDIRYRDVPWGRVDWVGRASEPAIECHSLVVRKAGGSLWVDGRLETGDYGADDGISVGVRLDRWPSEDLLHAFGWELPWNGPLSGRAEISGRRSAPTGTVALQSESGRYWGYAYEALDLDAVLKGDRVEATRGVLSLGGGRVQFRGTRTDAGEYDGTVDASDVEVGGLLPPLRPNAGWGGRFSGTARLKGTFDKPDLQASVTARRLFLGDEGVGAVDAVVNGSGDGRLHVRGRCESPRMHIETEGDVDAAWPHRADLAVRLRDTSLDPFARTLWPSESGNAVPPLIADAEVSLRGPLSQPAAIDAAIRASRLDILLPEYPVHSAGPVDLELGHGRLTVRELQLAGEGTNLVATGVADVVTDGPLDFSVRGDADLRALAAITRRFRARGAARLAVTFHGRRDAPRVDGTLELLGAGVRVRDLPHGLEDVQGSVRFTESAAQLQDVVGRLGGGEVSLRGETTYGRHGLLSVDLSLAGHDLALRYPEGLRSLSDGELRLFGDGERQWLTGTLDVRQAVWTRRYDLASELLASDAALRPASPSIGGGLRFDVKVNAPGTLKVDNNLATLEARAELRLQGTSDEPVVIGRADVDHGRVYFQGNTYVIRRGRIEFANPQRLDPFFDIEAETRLRSYRVNLKMSGTLDRVSPTLTSDPPLSAVQILNLLAGADESAVALGQASIDRGRLAEQGAASLAVGAASEGIGLERHAERLFGINRFSIDPAVLKGGGFTNPAARVTVGKRLTPDLSVLYSVDLHGTNERIFSIEYSLKDWLSVLMTSGGGTGRVGVDALVQRSR